MYILYSQWRTNGGGGGFGINPPPGSKKNYKNVLRMSSYK